MLFIVVLTPETSTLQPSSTRTDETYVVVVTTATSDPNLKTNDRDEPSIQASTRPTSSKTITTTTTTATTKPQLPSYESTNDLFSTIPSQDSKTIIYTDKHNNNKDMVVEYEDSHESDEDNKSTIIIAGTVPSTLAVIVGVLCCLYRCYLKVRAAARLAAEFMPLDQTETTMMSSGEDDTTRHESEARRPDRHSPFDQTDTFMMSSREEETTENETDVTIMTSSSMRPLHQSTPFRNITCYN